jgi:hypothetical protein
MFCPEIVKSAKWNTVIITAYNTVPVSGNCEDIFFVGHYPIFCKREYDVSTISGKMKG